MAKKDLHRPAGGLPPSTEPGKKPEINPPVKTAEKIVNDPRLVDLVEQMRRDISYVNKHWGNTYIERRVKEISVQFDALGIS